VDFNDVNTVMKDSGVAIMGSAEAEGDERALQCVENALSSPLLNDNDIKGATYVLLNITYGNKVVLMDEITEITDYIQEEAGSTADVIWGHGYDESLDDKLCVTVIATGFVKSPNTGIPMKEKPQTKFNLDEEHPTMITQKINSPLETVSDQNEENLELTKDEEPYMLNEQHDEGDLNITSAEKPYVEPDGKVRFHLEEDNLEDDQMKPSNTNEDWTFKKEIKNEEPIVPSVEENKELSDQRLEKIKKESQKMKSPTSINEMENEPAYKRRNIQLDDVPKSSETNVSRFSLGENEDEEGNKQNGLNENNSFLHDNVD
jgi:cell division protein FtsZ